MLSRLSNKVRKSFVRSEIGQEEACARSRPVQHIRLSGTELLMPMFVWDDRLAMSVDLQCGMRYLAESLPWKPA